MHVRKGAWRNVLGAVALVSFTLALQITQGATPASAQTPGGNQSFTSSIAGVGEALPGLAFNALGTTHQVIFHCSNDRPAGTTALLSEGCYDVTVQGQNLSLGTTINVFNVQCTGDGANSNANGGTSVGCGDTEGGVLCHRIFNGNNTITPSAFNLATGFCEAPLNATAGFVATNTTTTPADCAINFSGGAPDTVVGNVCRSKPIVDRTVAGTIQESSPYDFGVRFSGYVPAICPAGLTIRPGFLITAGNQATSCNSSTGFNFTCPAGTSGPNPFTAADAGRFACAFSVTAEKKYVEITNLTLTGTGPCATGAGASTLLFAEGLKTFFGTPCQVTAVATGVVILKTGVNCANEPGGNPNAAHQLAPDFQAQFPGSYYQCVGDTLSVIVPNITNQLNSGPIPVTITGTGASVTNQLPTPLLGTLCAGNTGVTSANTFTGVSVFVCPSGPGTGSVRACTAVAPPDTQPQVCSSTVNFNFILPNQNRVVPYVRWSGEKQVLTKCFGGAGLFGGALVEFTLEGAGANAQATLIPTSSGGTLGSTGGGELVFGTQNTVVTVTDPNGCASVIVYATGEGAVNVDAAIFSTATTTAGTAPLLNEHAFEIYYLKFDHIDLENLKPLTGPGANTVNSSTLTAAGGQSVTGIGFSATAASFNFPSAPGANQPAAGGFYSIPLCQFDYVRAMVHGYFELPGDPSGRPASNVTIPGAPNGAAGSYVLPAGRWVLPEDWPVLATFAGFNSGAPNDNTPSSVYAWDLNSGWVFNPGSERPVLCAGPTLAPSVNSFPGALGTTASGAIDNTNGGSGVSYGACFGTDKAGTNYSTAPQGPNCGSGVTVGIGPFDITQTCTNPLGLTYKPTGGTLLSANGLGTGFAINSLSTNSTYLPNGTLNQWDAPMPAAQVSFGITGGPGFLNQVNKTGFYSIPTLNASTGNVNGAVYPDPFYAEAIPASPLIPPVTNNGGYLWDTFGFRGGAVLGPTTTAATVAGLGAAVDVTALGVCFQNEDTSFTPVTSAGGTTSCFVGVNNVADATVTLAECTLLHGTFTVTSAAGTVPATGTCQIDPLPTSVPPGTNLGNFGPACPATAGTTATNASALSVDVANGAGFAAGQTVTIRDRVTNAVIASGLVIDTVAPDTDHIPTGTTLTFTAASVPGNLCLHVGQGVFVSDAIAVTVPASNAALGTLTPGSSVTLSTPSGRSATTTVASVDPATGTIVLNGAAALATALGGCVLGAPGCSPATFLPAGTLIQGGPAVGTAPIRDATPLFPTGIPGSANAVSGAGQGPYPFWQWVPNPASGSTPQSATVYSDNHGEAVISLETGIATTSAPPCVAPYVATPGGAVCLLNLAALGVAGNVPGGVAFQNILAARAFTGAAPGCIQTNPNGSTSAVAATTPVVGATGPANGQICVNNLGGIEFGAGATLGTTTVQAIADYPYTRGLHAAISSGAITKVFTSAFNKSVTVTPPGTGNAGPAGTSSYTVTITGTDICNNPIVGEPVNVFAIGNAGAVVLAPLGNGTSNGPNAATVILGAGGTASLTLEVLNSALGTNGLVIKAVFPLEQVERFVVVRQGQTAPQTTTVIYTPGYNMVGGPPGSNFGAAEALFTYDPTSNTYGNATASAGNVTSGPPSCTGYFAYFASATSVSLPVPSSQSPVTCTLAAGWNLVGNPFATPANLPSGTTAYHFNGTTYDQVSQIPVGGAVFVFQPAAGTLTLTP